MSDKSLCYIDDLFLARYNSNGDLFETIPKYEYKSKKSLRFSPSLEDVQEITVCDYEELFNMYINY